MWLSERIPQTFIIEFKHYFINEQLGSITF